MPSTTLDVPYHQQERLFFCGAAAAQMVLRGLGAPLFKQEPLYGQNHNYPTIDPASHWASPPDGLTATLEHNKPSKVAATVALGVADSADAISRKIVWSIHHHQLPAVALVEGDDHWMVVHGFDVTEEPQSPDDASFAIRAFDVRDPLPPSDQLDVPPVPPHATNDGCGSGDRRGQAPQHVTYVEWLDRYMTGVPSGFWQGKFLAVGDADAVPIRPGRMQLPPVEHDGDRIVPPGVAADGARDGLKAFGVADRQEWGAILRGTQPGTPTLVQRLDRLERYYYIVPFLRSRGKATAFALVDGTQGDYRQCAGVRVPTPVRTQTPQEILKRHVGTTYALPDQRGSLLVRPRAAIIYPLLVWKPCVESLSPYYPFHMIIVGDHRLYIRTDGKVFTELHEAGPGF